MARQFTDYRPLIAARIESITDIDIATDTRRQNTLDVLENTEKMPFGNKLYGVAIGDRVITPQTAPKGYRKTYLEYELVCLNKTPSFTTEAFVDYVYQVFDGHDFPTDSTGDAQALTTRVLDTASTEVVSESLPMNATIMTIEIVTLDVTT